MNYIMRVYHTNLQPTLAGVYSEQQHWLPQQNKRTKKYKIILHTHTHTHKTKTKKRPAKILDREKKRKRNK